VLHQQSNARQHHGEAAQQQQRCYFMSGNPSQHMLPSH
jgi:hypothetical protein